MKCRQCGKKIEKDNRICPHCGYVHDLEASEIPSELTHLSIRQIRKRINRQFHFKKNSIFFHGYAPLLWLEPEFLLGTAHLAVALTDLQTIQRDHVLQVTIGRLIGKSCALGDSFHCEKLFRWLEGPCDQFQCGAADSLCGGRNGFLLFFQLPGAVQQTDVKLDTADEIGYLDGLQGKITGARFNKTIGHILAFINGKDNDRDIGVQLPKHLDALHSVDSGQMVIDEDDVGLLLLKQLQTGGNIPRGYRCPALKLKDRAKGKEDLFIVIDH